MVGIRRMEAESSDDILITLAGALSYSSPRPPMRANREMTTVVITVPLQPGKSDLARREFEAIIQTVVTNEAACHGIDLHTDPENPDRLLLIEYWDSKEAFIGPHMQTQHMKDFLARAQSFVEGTPDFGFWKLLAATPT